MGALIRAYDWESSALGDPGAWPQSLKTVMRLLLSTQHPMLIWWGPQLVQFYNDAYARCLGPEHHPQSLGQPAAECWTETWEIVGSEIEGVISGRGAIWRENRRVPIRRNGVMDEAYWTYSYSPIDEPAAPGGVGGVLVICTETTKAILTDQALRQKQARQDFRVALGDALRGLGDPKEIMRTAAEQLGRYLAVDQAYYYAIDGDGFVIESEWTSDCGQAVLGRHRLADFGRETVAQARSGRLVRLNDTTQDDAQGGYAKAGMGALISAPLMRDGRWIGGVHVHQRTPRIWTDAETDLVREVAERTGAEAERALAQASLVASEQRYRALVTSDGPMMFRAAADGTLIESPGWEARTGYPRHSYQGFNWLELVHPDDRDRMVAQWMAAIAGGEPLHIQYRMRDPVGAWRWTRGHTVPVKDENGRILEWVGTMSDIHDQRLAEEALRESESRFRQLAETIQEVFYITDVAEMRLVYISPAFEKTWGRPGSWLMEDLHRLIETIHPDDRAQMILARGARRLGQKCDVEFRIRRPDGTERWILDRSFPIRADGALRTAGLAQDITERKQAEAGLRLLNETLEQRVAAEVAERSRAESALRQAQKMEAIGQLTGGVAHDFNNLLTIIRGSTDLLRRDGLTEARRRRYVDAISDTADRAAKLTAQLLAFSRRQALTPVIFDIGARVITITEMINAVLGSRVLVDVKIEAEPALVEADISQFETALVNLAANARDAMDGEGQLTIRLFESAPPTVTEGATAVSEPDGYIAISVRDTGCGIPDAHLGQIFEPFFTTKEVGRGTGLGLSQVYGFVKQSGGEVTVDSQVGHGADFTLYLPRARKPPKLAAGDDLKGDHLPERPPR
jgi:PAS domain S-box-containing protein